MHNFFKNKNGWIWFIIFFPAITYFSSIFNYRIDLTQENRYSLSQPTINLLKNLDSSIEVKVFLTGDLPSDYQKLNISVKDLLSEFKDLSNNKIQFNFEKPGEELPDSSKAVLYDSLQQLGVVFEQLENISSNSDKAINQLIIPSAIVYFGNEKPQVIDLRSSRKIFKNFNVITEVPQEDKAATLNSAEALLEFKFANAIDKLTRNYVPAVAYAIGNGEPLPPEDLRVNDLGAILQDNYRLGLMNLKLGYPDPSQIDALLIVKPTQPFTDEDKLKLDQYVMNGGKIIWAIDRLYAELDSLMRSQSDFVAFDRNLNIDDILFKYGIRINSDLLQDLYCSKIPIVVGRNPDNSPVIRRLPWPYYPFLSAVNDNPIAKNLDRVLSIFPSSIDLIDAPEISKTVLLATDTNSRVLNTPAMVSINSVKDESDFKTFNRSHVPVAVLVEGKFTSLFANRLTKVVQDSIKIATGKPFEPKGIKPSKQIIISDADIITNAVSPTIGPLPMGEIPFENYRFANREFFLNSVDYLVSNSGIFEARNKDFTLRLLDKQKVESQKTFWQFMNIVVPVALILLFGFIYNAIRKQKFRRHL